MAEALKAQLRKRGVNIAPGETLDDAVKRTAKKKKPDQNLTPAGNRIKR